MGSERVKGRGGGYRAYLELMPLGLLSQPREWTLPQFNGRLPLGPSGSVPCLPFTMAATTTENLNGVSSRFQWSPGICCELRTYPFVSPLFLRVGRVRRKVGTYRFHRPTPVRHLRISPVCLSSIVCISVKNGLIYAKWSSTKFRKCASPSFSVMSSAHSRSAPRISRCSWKIQSIRPQDNPRPL